MRPTCTYCARKHLAQALILMQEAVQGYPEHRWLAIGHLAEAADELLKIHPEMAHKIRRERKRYESNWTDTGHVTVMELIVEVGTLDMQLSVAPSYAGKHAIQRAPRVNKHPEQPIYQKPNGELTSTPPFSIPTIPTPPHPDFKELGIQCYHYYNGGHHRYSAFRHDGWLCALDHSEEFFTIEKTIEGRYWKIRVDQNGVDQNGVNKNAVQQPIASPEETPRTGDGFALEPWSKERIEATYPRGPVTPNTAINLYAAANQVVPQADEWPTFDTVVAVFKALRGDHKDRTFVITHGSRGVRISDPSAPLAFGVTLGTEKRIYKHDQLPYPGTWVVTPEERLTAPGQRPGPIVERPVEAYRREQAAKAYRAEVPPGYHLAPMTTAYPGGPNILLVRDVSGGPRAEQGLPAAPSGECPPCIQAYDDQVYTLLNNALNDGREYVGTVIILTTLSNFHPSYSLVSVILEQAHALALGGRRVLLVVHRGCDVKDLPPLPPEIILLPLLPVVPWHPDEIREDQVVQFARFFERFLSGTTALGAIDIITHDVMFQAAYVTLAKAIHDLRERAYVCWFHMAHSSVGERPDNKQVDTAGPQVTGFTVWPIWYRCTLPPGHHLLVLNHSDRIHFHKYYRCGYDSKALDVTQLPEAHIHTLLNPRDIRPFLRMTPTAAWLTTRYGLHLADVTVLFPVSMTRIRDKRLHLVIQMLGALKRMGLTVRLLIPTAHANGDGFVTGVAYVKEHALKEGLIVAPDDTPIARPLTGVPGIDLTRVEAALPYSTVEVSPAAQELMEAQLDFITRMGVAPLTTEDRDRAARDAAFVGRPGAEDTNRDPGPEVILTCSVLPDTRANGLDADTIRSLWGVTNVFMLPSISEAGSLILLEAALAGCVLVLNQSLPALHDYIPLNKAIWVPWGSIKGPGEELKPEHIAQYAEGIWSQATGNLRRQMMQKHSLESYAVALGEILDGYTADPDGHDEGYVETTNTDKE
jgi:hypothetical protein